MAQFDGSVIWSEALEIAKGEIPEQEYLMWFRLGYQSLDGNTLTVKAPNSFLRDQFKRKYHSFMEKIVQEITAMDIALEVSSVKMTEAQPVKATAAEVSRDSTQKNVALLGADGLRDAGLGASKSIVDAVSTQGSTARPDRGPHPSFAPGLSLRKLYRRREQSFLYSTPPRRWPRVPQGSITRF